MADWNPDKWNLEIARGNRHRYEIERHEFDEAPERYERGGHVEWYGVDCGEDVFIEYEAGDIFFSVVHAPLTEEEKNQDGLIVRYTNFYDQ